LRSPTAVLIWSTVIPGCKPNGAGLCCCENASAGNNKPLNATKENAIAILFITFAFSVGDASPLSCNAEESEDASY
jgi:hypothetical protein